MAIQTDYHMHSFCSVDSSAPMLEMCRSALDAGLETVIFTEHKDFIAELEGCDYFNYETYTHEIEQCRKEFPSLTVKTGIEVDYTSGYRENALEFVSEYDFDFRIGSVHYLGTDPISETRSVEFFKTAPKQEVLPFYWNELKACAGTGVFDAIGHLDMIKRYSIPFYGPFEAAAWEKEITEILNLMISTETILEINSSGLRHEPEEIYPCKPILKKYKDLGGTKVTAGSDAHVPEHVAYKFDQVEKLIEEFGLSLLEI